MAVSKIVRRSGKGEQELTKRTLAIAFPLRSHAEGDEMTWEDVQERFGGATPSEVMVNVFNIAIDATATREEILAGSKADTR